MSEAPLLAKSVENGGTTLADHTDHVVKALMAIVPHLMPSLSEHEREVAKHGAILHDLGKAHPVFQEALKPNYQRDIYQCPLRHEIASLLFLPLFPSEEWGDLIDMVVGHHKSVRCQEMGKKGKGLLDLVEEWGAKHVFTRHSENWERWHPLLFSTLEQHDVATRLISLKEARSAFDFTFEYCESKRAGRSRWRGLLMSADHLASALQEETEEHLERLFLKPDLSTFTVRAQGAPATLYPLAKYSTDIAKPHTLVIAPTGSGKTDFLLRRCQSGRVFYLLPFQASINAMYQRFKTLLGEGTDIRRVHAASRIDIDGVLEEQIMQRHPGAAIKVMTPHQLASLVFGTSGHEAIALDVAGQDVIMDEVHVYSEASQAMVLELVRVLIGLGVHVHIGTATIPQSLVEKIVALMGGEETIYQIRLNNEELRSYNRHIVTKLASEEEGREQIRKAVNEGKRVLFLSNRVATAQERYNWVQREFMGTPVLLVHSRYKRGDRASLESQIEEYDKGDVPCVVCATQVVEVSLDISFDTLVTDVAPLDSLVQRFGRVNRRRYEGMLPCPVYVIAPPETQGEANPYNLEVLRRTYEALPGALLEETVLQSLIDSVYPEINIQAIDMHLAEVNGEFRLQELCHRPRSVLLESLEIETATVICEGDSEAYRKGRGASRQRLEIPVPVSAVFRFVGKWSQMKKIGSEPFVVSDTLYCEKCGLFYTEEEKNVHCIHWQEVDSSGQSRTERHIQSTQFL